MNNNEETKTGSRRTGLETVAQMMKRFSATASADTCFGAPVKVDDRTIIPVAEVVSGFGAGGGGGEGKEGPEPGTGDSEGQAGSGEGAGGGGFTRSRPVAVVVVAPEGVTVEPVIDATQIAMAGLAAGAFLGFWLVRMLAITEAPARKAKTPSLKSIVGTLKRI
jgi:uncharacterized spore protein YtfJ